MQDSISRHVAIGYVPGEGWHVGVIASTDVPGTMIEVAVWPWERMLFLCPYCSNLHIASALQMPPDGQLVALDPGMCLVPDLGQTDVFPMLLVTVKPDETPTTVLRHLLPDSHAVRQLRSKKRRRVRASGAT